jgi:phosphopantothenoylcysteine decarboxylase / phosphopantothenate---cysteine ligase
VLAVTGGIACYKSVTLARDLTRLGAEVDVILSRAAREFVRPLLFEGVTGRPAVDSLWSAEGAARHIRMAREADTVVVAPATADLLARAAQGRADDLLTTVLLATRAPVLLAPAMNDRMWSHPQTQRNADHLESVLGYTLVGPEEGPLAAGEGEGPGRMTEPELLVEQIGRILGTRAPWAGLPVLVTAGPTREAVDAVRYLGNRSSGRMGYALAREAWLRGADVTLLSGPTALPDPQGVRVIRVESAREMRDHALELAPRSRLQLFAAAVADFRPDRAEERKRKRDAVEKEGWSLVLEENPDVALETLGKGPPGVVRVGFALETDDLLANARAKLEAKGFDLVVANPADDPGAGFESQTNRGWIVDVADLDTPTELPLQSKEAMARTILDRAEHRFAHD